MAELIEISNAAIEGRKPNLIDSQTPVSTAEPTMAELIEVSNAAIEGRKPNLIDSQTPVSTAEPTMAELIEISNAAIEGRKPNLPVASSTSFAVDNAKEQGYNIGESVETVEVEVERQQKTVNNVAKLPRIKCIHQDLAGKRHPVTGVLYTERIVTIDGQQCIVVAPEFDSIFDIQLPDELRYASDGVQFRYCTYQMRKVLKTNVGLKELFTEEQLASISKGKTPDGYTWHHDVEVGRMQLVLTEVHKKQDTQVVAQYGAEEKTIDRRQSDGMVVCKKNPKYCSA